MKSTIQLGYPHGLETTTWAFCKQPRAPGPRQVAVPHRALPCAHATLDVTGARGLLFTLDVLGICLRAYLFFVQFQLKVVDP